MTCIQAGSTIRLPGAVCELEIRAELGHVYPPDFEASLSGALGVRRAEVLAAGGAARHSPTYLITVLGGCYGAKMRDEHCVLEEREAVELVAFLVTSAHGLATEPTEYGPMRLLEAARRLSRHAATRSSDRTTALFDTLTEGISTWMQERHRDPVGATAVLDESCRAIARYLKEQESESEAQE